MQNGQELPLERCPHCGVNKPRLIRINQNETTDFKQTLRRFWCCYQCVTCGGVTLTVTHSAVGDVMQMWPTASSIPDTVPLKARTFLTQAIASLHAPAGALMLAASGLDAMLKDKGYLKGSLNDRIDEASKKHLITEEMAAWAHEIRLDANDQRHADENAPLPTQDDANKVIEFAQALAQFLYVLPARVARGRKTATQS